ncbi:MAG TPA: Holliday junction resolvase RuvX [Pyrinomonadaceae bacterium]|nr:Holliday junction resolvase RuvX [Pyrinomonadaceae bacterium]
MPETDTTDERLSTRGTSTRQGGRLLALDLGQRRVGVAVSDELCITVSPQTPLSRTNWKQLLLDVRHALKSFDAQGLVIGLPLNMDGSEGFAAQEARRLAANFEKSLNVPVYLQDERLTSREAEANLRAAKHTEQAIRGLADSEAAGIILRDFIADKQRSYSPPDNSTDDT